MTKKYFLELAQYNIWANNQICEWLSQITEEQWNETLVGSFTSLESTVLHLAAAEKIWHERLEKNAGVWLPSVFKGNREEVIAIWKEYSAKLLQFVTDLPEAELLEKFAFKNNKGEGFFMEYYRALAHVFNHSTYHRGQIVNYLRQVGFTGVGSTDLMYFYRYF